jgi:hypothetical protein
MHCFNVSIGFKEKAYNADHTFPEEEHYDRVPDLKANL